MVSIFYLLVICNIHIAGLFPCPLAYYVAFLENITKTYFKEKPSTVRMTLLAATDTLPFNYQSLMNK